MCSLLWALFAYKFLFILLHKQGHNTSLYCLCASLQRFFFIYTDVQLPRCTSLHTIHLKQSAVQQNLPVTLIHSSLKSNTQLTILKKNSEEGTARTTFPQNTEEKPYLCHLAEDLLSLYNRELTDLLLAWFGNCSEADRADPQSVVNTA